MAKETPKYVKSSIDEIDNMNARHFVSLGKEAAVKELLHTFGPNTEANKDTAWANKAYDKMVDDVKLADSPKPETKKA